MERDISLARSFKSVRGGSIVSLLIKKPYGSPVLYLFNRLVSLREIMPLRRVKLEICSFLLIISLGIVVHGVCQAAITFGPLVTDVNPANFAVVWATSEPATCSVNVFLDADGTTPYTEAVINSESGAHPPAEDVGVMKVQVGGLKADTTYYYQIITVSNEGVFVEPASGPLPSVHTEYSSALVITNNGSLAHKVFESDGATPADGTLVVAEVPGASHPITAWTGVYSTFPGWGFLVLDNLYDQAGVYGNGGHVSLQLSGGETITLTSVGGSSGFRRLIGTLPQELGGTVELDPVPSDDDCTLDVAGPIIENTQIQPLPNSFINNDKPLIKGAYHDANLYSEIDTTSVRLLVDGADVTSDAAVDATTVEYRPMTPLAEGRHDVTLEVADEWGNEAVPFTWSFEVDVTPLTATVAYSATNTSHVDVGTLTITATFSESLMTSPQIAIYRPTPMSTIGPDNMNGSNNVWTYDVTVETHNGTTVIDGVNMVVISNATDLAGNTAPEDFTSIFTTDTKDTDGDGERDYVDSDDDNDSLPDSWEETYGLDPLDANGPNGKTGDFDNDGWSNFEEYVSGTDPADNTSPVPTPPEIVQVIPKSDTTALVPKNTSFAVLIEDSDGIDITETGSIKFTIDDQNVVYERELDANSEVVRVVKLSDDDDTRVTRLWVVYDRSCEAVLGDYPWGAAVQITVDAKDRRQDWMAPASYTFQIGTETDYSQTHLPDTEPIDSTDPALEGFYDVGQQVINGDLQGAKIIYNSSEPVPPAFGPLDELPLVNMQDGEAVGMAVNFQPPTVFNTPVKIFIPCPRYADVSSLSVYYYNGTKWVLACDASGTVQPQAADWMVPGSRRNHNNGGPSTIEIKVYHLSGAQAASNGSTQSGDSGGGGGGGGCFISVLSSQ
jgi:hypothetical protein